VKKIFKKAMAIVRPEKKRTLPFMCPRCGAEVDATSPACPECGARFLIGIYTCGNCGERVSADDEVCPHCGTSFYTGKERYFCPECGAEVEKDATYCEKCGSTFWSPIKREFCPCSLFTFTHPPNRFIKKSALHLSVKKWTK